MTPPADVAGWRPYGLALLPLALAGALPAWQVAALCAVYALGVRWPEWVQGRLLLGVLVVAGGAALAVPGVLGGPPEGVVGLAASSLLGLLAVGLLHLGAVQIEAGHRSGLLITLGLGLLAPQALLLPALVGGAVARPAEDDRPAAWHVAPGPAAWRWVGAVLVGVTLAVALLPRGPSVWAALTRPPEPVVAAAEPAPDTPADEVPATPSGRAETASPARPAPPLRLTVNAPLLPMELVLGAGVLLGAAVLWRSRPRAGGTPATLVEKLMALGLIVGGVVGLGAVFVLTASSGSGGGGAAGGARSGATGGPPGSVGWDTPGRTLDLTGLLNVLVILSVLLLVGLAVAAFLARQDDAGVPDDEPPVPDDPEPGERMPAPAPLHRVRRAWQAAESALVATGRARGAAESPQAYAARVGRDVPVLAQPLADLVRVYAPVRYGGDVTDAGAGVAERALTDLRVLIPSLPSVHPSRG
ncbi:DUF4129 domain-containing protein [Deinococcus yunweiensis]|uniref:DUF4129 domain-containing protein n=1 Tax=Deinococcus yunweiensis TaxID=367282 RepID=UPI00398F7895